MTKSCSSIRMRTVGSSRRQSASVTARRCHGAFILMGVSLVMNRPATCGDEAQECHALRRLRNGAAAPFDSRSRRLLERPRSEEHTSELQSLMRISYAVFCLKKKKIEPQPHSSYQ